MSSAFSVGLRLAGGGGGDRAYYAVRALRAAGFAQQLYVSSAAGGDVVGPLRSMGLAGRALRFVAYRTHSDWLNRYHDRRFDRWVAAQLRPCGLFHGFTLHALASLQRARELGAVAVLDRGMAHPRQYADMLDEEYRRLGVDRRFDPRRVERELRELERADLVLVGSAASRDTYVARGWDSQRLVLIPYGVDIGRFHPVEVTAKRPFRVLFVGQVGLGKGVAYLLQAWRRLAWTDAELWLAGNVSSESRTALRGLLDQAGVRLLGYVRRPEELYRAADVFCLPTLSEGSALVTYEAMACGLAMVTTPEAGAPAVDEEQALLVPARDVSALALALQRLRDDAALRVRLGQAARSLAVSYTWESYGERLVALYRRLLAA